MESTMRSERPKAAGWLLFFAITLVAVGPLIRLAGLVSSYTPVMNVAHLYPKFAAIYVLTCGVEIAMIAVSIMAGVFILKVRPGAVRFAKIFLLLNPLILFATVVAYQLGDMPSVAVNAMAAEGAKQVVRTLIYSTIWFLYLARSRRVKETFGPRVEMVAAPAAPKLRVGSM